MGVNQEEKDKAVLAMLRGGRSTSGEDPETVVSSDLAHDRAVETGLRAMGYNRIEREKLRRGRPPGRPRPTNEAKYRNINAKRFRYYLEKRLPNRTGGELAQLVAEWVEVTDCDLALAKRWWDADVDPENPGQLAEAIVGGFQMQDLARIVKGKTIAEYLQGGCSVTSCLRALRWRCLAS
jgi:hypothetical protein